MYYRYPILTKKAYKDSFRYKNIFQILPYEEEFNLELADFHFVSVLEINIEELFKCVDKSINIELVFSKKRELLESGVEKINLSEARALIHFDYYINYAKSIVLGLLSLFTLFEHFDYPEETSNAWFTEIPPEPKGMIVKWGKKWLPINKSQIEKFSTAQPFNKIEEINPLEYYKTVGLGHNKIKFPSDILSKLDMFFNMEIEVREVINSSIIYFMHANHIKEDFPSLAIVSLVNSMENLVNYEHKNSPVEKCDECGQNRFRITRKFNNFIDEHLEGYYSRKEIKKMIGDIYSKRSKIVHTGKLYESEKFKPIWEGSFLDSNLDLEVIISVTRIAINSWMKKYCT